MKKMISFIITINILFLMIPNAIVRLADILNLDENLLTDLFKISIIFFIVFLILISILILPGVDPYKKIFINWKAALYLFLLILSLIITASINKQPFSWRLSGYLLLLLTLVTSIFDDLKIFFSKMGMYYGIIVYTLVNSILGILQYLKGTPIVPIFNREGQSTVVSIQLKSGFLGIIGRRGYRAFGMFDSGMSLGLFSLLALSIIIYSNIRTSSWIRGSLMVIYIFTVVATLTRNIYVSFLVLLFLFFAKEVNKKRILFLIGICMQLLTILLASALNNLSFLQNDFFETLRSRYRGLIFFQNYYQHNLLTTLFGHGYQYDSTLKTMTALTVDNQMYATYLDIGIVGLLFIYIYIYNTMKKDINGEMEPFQNMIVVFAFFGIANNHITFFSGIILLYILLLKSESKVNNGENLINGV